MPKSRSILGLSCLIAAQMSAAQKPTLFYIPHTHWEGAVFYTREEYLDIGLSHILEALRLLEKYPDYKFTLDQVAYFKPFLERYPEEAAAFRKFIKEGRLEIVGGMDVMPDDVKPGGELFVRQVQYGKDYCRKALGLDIDVAWLLDTFGHHPQMPQLLKEAGFKSFWFCRGVPKDDLPSEFLWKGIDGTEFPSFWLPGFYGLFYGPPRDQPGFNKFFEERYHSLDSHAHGNERVGLAGVDVSEPEDFVPPLVRAFNKRGDAPFFIRFSVPTDFANVVAKRKDLPVFDFDLNPIFQGTYSSRIELKQEAKEIEQELLTAENVSALAMWSGRPSGLAFSDSQSLQTKDENALWQAWEPLLFNQTHDLASGTMVDQVYADTVQSYAYSKRLGQEILQAKWNALAKHIDTRGSGTPIVVFNPTGWARTDLVSVDLGFASKDGGDIKLVGPNGENTPWQATDMERYGDGTIRRARVSFLAKNVPSFGYAVYHAIPVVQARKEQSDSAGNSLENEFYKVSVNRKTGEISSIVDQATGHEFLSGPANVIARQEDKGDLWELYHTLDGAMYLASTDKQPVPASANSLLSNAFGDKEGQIVRGPAFQEFAVSHPFGTGTFSTQIRLTMGVRRIDIETTLVNQEKQVRYQVLFPTAIRNGSYTQEIPFGCIARPAGTEYPAQNWVDYSDGSHGMALLNFGTPGNLVTDGTLMLSLLRSESLGDYNLGHPSDSGYELGVPRTFRYSLVPHEGGWREASIFRSGVEFTKPLLAFKEEPHSGELPKKWGLFDVSAPNVVVTTVKPGSDGTTIIRLYESAGRPTSHVHISFHTKLAAANEANLLEDKGKPLPVSASTVVFNLHAFEIKTIKVKLAR